MTEATSSIGESQHMDPILEERIRSQCWTEAAGGKQKGLIYGTRDLASVYNGGENGWNPKEERERADLQREGRKVFRRLEAASVLRRSSSLRYGGIHVRTPVPGAKIRR
ncbi:hypothetical protein Fmac_028402 [Flemingia macrophylla]|uniref:Uncharacterized protein n=1 Tax=Flemingia macrophylla TaxID=520843 RepID=A0ABD1L7S4_9FABA